MNELDGIKQFIIVVVDSGDIEFICYYYFQDVIINFLLLFKAVGLL